MQNRPGDEGDFRPKRVGHRVFWWTCGAAFLILLFVILIPWDVPMPEAPDLEYTPPSIPAEANAFSYLEAARPLQVRRPIELEEWYLGSPSRPWNQALADDVLKDNAPVFAELEKALGCREYVSPRTTNLKDNEDRSADRITSVWLLGVKSRQEHQLGHHAEACRYAMQNWRLGTLLSEGHGSLPEWRSGQAGKEVAFMQLEPLASDAKTPDDLLRQVLTELEQQDPQRQVRGFRRALQNDFLLWKQIELSGRDFTEIARKHFAYSTGGLRMNYYPLVWRWLRPLPYATKPNLTLQQNISWYRTMIAAADKPCSKLDLNYPGRPREPIGDMDIVRFYFQPNSLGLEYFLAFAENKEFLSQPSHRHGDY